MCNPAAVFMGAQVVGGAAQANAAQQEGRAQQRYYEYLAGQNEKQAQAAIQSGEDQTSLIQDSAATETSNLRRSQRQFVGSQKVALAANGVPLSSVTAEDLAHDTFKKEEMDAETIRYNADVKSWEAQTSARNQAVALRDQASGYRMAGANARRAGDTAAVTSLLGTATSVAGSWYQYGQTSAGKSAPGVANVKGKGYVPTAPADYYKRGR